MRHVLSLLLLLWVLWFVTPAAQATTYYVAGGTGGVVAPGVDPPARTCPQASTIGTPLLTIAQGLLCLNNTGGDILYIRGGNYTSAGRIDYPPNKSGTSDTSRNMMAGYPGETVTIQGLALVSASSTRIFRYLIFDNLIIDGGGIGQSEIYGVQTYTGHNIYRNLDVKNVPAGNGISNVNEFDEIHHSKIHHNGLQQTTGNQTHGLYICNNNVTVHDNEIYTNAANGIQFYSSAPPVGGCANNVKIYNNNVYDNVAVLQSTYPTGHSASGIVVCCGNNVEIYNNLIYSNGQTPGAWTALAGLQFIAHSSTSTGYKVYNNTIWNNNGPGIYIASGLPSLVLKNNILWQNAGATLTDVSGQSTLDSTNLTVDPKFTNVSASNFTPLTGSPAINTAATLTYSGFATDYYGKPRPGVAGTASDKGAIEVQAGGPPVVEPPPPNNVYYVSRGEGGTPMGDDARTCTQAKVITTPRKTIQKGLECVAQNGNTSGGDTVYVRTGTYAENVELSDGKFKSGISGHPNMISTYQGENVLIYPGNGGQGFRLAATATNPLEWIIIDGFRLRGNGQGMAGPPGGSGSVGSYAVAISKLYTNHNIYRNLESFNWGETGMGGGGSAEIHHVIAHDNGFAANNPNNPTGNHGFYLCIKDSLIHDNIAYNNAGNGFQFYYNGPGAATCGDNTKIYNNIAYNNREAGFVIGCGANLQVYNNVSYHNAYVVGPQSGNGMTIGYAGAVNMKVWNNTIAGNLGTGILILSETGSVEVKNNLFYGNNDGAGGVEIDNRAGSKATLITNWQTSNGNPLFVDGTNATLANRNYHLQATTPAKNVGSTVAIALDADGLPRPSPPGGAVDMGAYEVQQGAPPVVIPPGIVTIYVAPPPLGNDSTHDCTAAKQETTPKATITGPQGGISCLTAGSTLLMKAGTYAEEIDTSLRSIPGGADWDHATVLAAAGNDVVRIQLVGAGVGLFFKNPATDHYIILDRLIVDGLGQNNTNGFVCYPGAHHIRFQNGEIKNTWYEPVYLSDGAGCEVLHSTLHDWGNLHGIRARGAVSGTIIRGNTIYNGPGHGIKIDSNETDTAISGVLIEQNILHHVGTTSSLAALFIGGASNTGLLVKNNLLYSSYRGIEVPTGSPTVKVYNNTVYGMTNTGIQVNSGATNTQVKNNISYGNGASPIVDNGSASDCCVTNQVLDPAFKNVALSDFQLQATSTAINAGVDLAPDVVFDLVGVRRADYGAYDYGAYEFTETVSVGGEDSPGPRRTGGAGPARELFQSR